MNLLNKRDKIAPRTPIDLERRFDLDSINNKIDKEQNKGLSTNDFSDKYKQDCDSNTRARHIHGNKSVLDDITREMVDGMSEGQLYTLFTGNNKNIQLSDNPTNYDLIGISYGNSTISDMKFVLPVNNIQFYISLNTTNEEKSLCTINGNTLTSESINISKVIGFKFRKGVVQSVSD